MPGCALPLRWADRSRGEVYRTEEVHETLRADPRFLTLMAQFREHLAGLLQMGIFERATLAKYSPPFPVSDDGTRLPSGTTLWEAVRAAGNASCSCSCAALLPPSAPLPPLSYVGHQRPPGGCQPGLSRADWLQLGGPEADLYGVVDVAPPRAVRLH